MNQPVHTPDLIPIDRKLSQSIRAIASNLSSQCARKDLSRVDAVSSRLLTKRREFIPRKVGANWANFIRRESDKVP